MWVDHANGRCGVPWGRYGRTKCRYGVARGGYGIAENRFGAAKCMYGTCQGAGMWAKRWGDQE